MLNILKSWWYIIAKIISPLTNMYVKKAMAYAKEYILNDSNGLQLRIKPSGSTLWVLKYSNPFMKVRTNIDFGTYPKVTLANVIDKRKAARELLDKNIDPIFLQDQEKLAQ